MLVLLLRAKYLFVAACWAEGGSRFRQDGKWVTIFTRPSAHLSRPFGGGDPFLARLNTVRRMSADKPGESALRKTSPACRTCWNRRASGPLHSVRPRRLSDPAAGGLPYWIIVSAGEVSEKDVDHVDRLYRSKASRPSYARRPLHSPWESRWRGPRRPRRPLLASQTGRVTQCPLTESDSGL
jgi:hypothetical protein